MKYVNIRTTADVLTYYFTELKNMTIRSVTLDNQILTPDQYTLENITFTITEASIKVDANQYLNIGYQWEKRN